MAEQLLDGAQVGAPVQQMRRERMAKRVRVRLSEARSVHLRGP